MLVFTFSYPENLIILTGPLPKGFSRAEVVMTGVYSGMICKGETQLFSVLVIDSSKTDDYPPLAFTEHLYNTLQGKPLSSHM